MNVPLPRSLAQPDDDVTNVVLHERRFPLPLQRVMR